MIFKLPSDDSFIISGQMSVFSPVEKGRLSVHDMSDRAGPLGNFCFACTSEKIPVQENCFS